MMHALLCKARVTQYSEPEVSWTFCFAFKILVRIPKIFNLCGKRAETSVMSWHHIYLGLQLSDRHPESHKAVDSYPWFLKRLLLT